MPLYSTDSRSGLGKRKFERSPKIILVTNAADVRSIPREIRGMVRDERRIIRDFPEWLRSESDACLLWYSGDRFLEGSAADLLKALHSPNRRSFVVVNTPCVQEVPFVTVQPRIFVKPASIDRWSFQVRIENDGIPAIPSVENSSQQPEAWAKLLEAVSAEKTKPGAGVEPLLGLWESRRKHSDVIGALALRNLVAAMLQLQETANARKFLEAGGKLYPTYAEVHYLAALLAVREQRFGEASPHLVRAKSCGTALPGSGGENSYRCDWLFGMLAARVGSERAAFEHFLAGVRCNPPFEPSLTELLKLCLPRSVIENHQYEFTRAVRGNPAVRTRIVEFLSRHGASDAARRIAQLGSLDTEISGIVKNDAPNTTVVLQDAVRPDVDRGCARVSKLTVGVVLEGPIFEHSSLGRITREIARALLSQGQEVRLEASTPGVFPSHLFADGKVLAQCINKGLQQTNLTIRHQWPPSFRRPATGKLAVILPWEYGGVPRVWIEQIQRNVDELWVPSNFVRDIVVRNGVRPEDVFVVPNGYDPRIFKPDGASLRPQGSRGFIFLFVGGAISRKGVDLLLDAYKAAFDASESVTLVLLVSGSTGAYQHNSLIPEIRAAATDPKRAPILPIFETIDDSTLASLYRGCDAFVLPYRGEGFGMPILEAMACAKPVIATAEGPTKDFCDEANSYLVSANAELVLDKPPPLGPLAGTFTWFEPSFLELVKALRHVWENREEAKAKGCAAAGSVRRFTWQSVTEQYVARIRRLCDLPVGDDH